MKPIASLLTGASVAATLLFATAPREVAAQESTVDGWINIVWDAFAPGNPDGIEAFVARPDGTHIRIRGTAPAISELVSLDRQYARISLAKPLVADSRGALSGNAVSWRLLPAPGSPNAALQVTQRPFITILCKYADDPSAPATPADIERITGPTYPGVAHFYAEQSQDPAVMSGNRTVGWYVLPRPRSEYIRDNATDFGLLANDCTAAADADVNFPEWYGINLQFNGALSNRTVAPFDPLSFGGGWSLNRDGQTRVYGMTWMGGSFTRNYVVYDHEMGHALGWPHSSGRYGSEYDSRWDVMSVGYLNFTQQYGWLPVHTISSHKDRAGWIPASRKWIAQPATSEARVITRSALPPANGDMLMAEIRISDRSVYTVETRRVAGYDTPLPGEAVILHRVDDGRAYVVDPDNNGDPNDASAMWLPGEMFTDAQNQISISVESSTATGFVVRITRGGSSFTIVGNTDREPAVVGTQYADTIRTQGALGTPTWTLTGGALPDGLSLGAASGIISGSPSRSGRFSYTLTAAAGGSSATKSFVTDVVDPLVIAPGAARRPGGVGSPYADTLRATGGSGTYNWSVTGGALPPGLSLSPLGVITGVPSSAGTFEFTANALSPLGTKALSASTGMNILIHSALVIMSDSVRPQALMGGPYADTLKASGSTGSFTWKLVEGTLPDGLVMDAGGVISGTALQAGQSRARVSVSTQVSTTPMTVVITVNKPSLQPEKVMDQLFGSGTLTSTELKFLDLIGNRNGQFDIGDVRAWLIDTGRVKANLLTPGKR